MMEPGESRLAMERVQRDCKLECCTKSIENIKYLTTCHRGSVEGVVGIMDYPPDVFQQTKHQRGTIEKVAEELVQAVR